MIDSKDTQAMRDNIQSWTPEDLRVGLMLQYHRIGTLVDELAALKQDFQDYRNEVRAEITSLEAGSVALERKITWDCSEPLRCGVSSIPGHIAREVPVKPKEKP